MKNRKILISFLLFFALILISNVCMAKDLDRINEYTITIDPRANGTLDMNYHLEWEVLDSESEGPLEWIKIGIPNANVSGITAISNNIKKISYYQDKGDYIRIDFKESYKQGSIIDIDFKFDQAYMYTLSSGYCNYNFIPGWFPDIYVKNLTIKWNADDVSTYSPKAKVSRGYYVWSTSLAKGRTYSIDVSYPEGTFKTSKSMQASNATITSSYNNNSGISAGIVILFVLVFAVSILSSICGGGYSSRRGWGYSPYRSYRSYRSWNNNSSSWGSSSSSCVSSCACACACAGGGRAGCSKKDLYGTNVRTKKLNEILNKKITNI